MRMVVFMAGAAGAFASSPQGSQKEVRASVKRGGSSQAREHAFWAIMTIYPPVTMRR